MNDCTRWLAAYDDQLRTAGRVGVRVGLVGPAQGTGNVTDERPGRLGLPNGGGVGCGSRPREERLRVGHLQGHLERDGRVRRLIHAVDATNGPDARPDGPLRWFGRWAQGRTPLLSVSRGVSRSG